MTDEDEAPAAKKPAVKPVSPVKKPAAKKESSSSDDSSSDEDEAPAKKARYPSRYEDFDLPARP